MLKPLLKLFQCILYLMYSNFMCMWIKQCIIETSLLSGDYNEHIRVSWSNPRRGKPWYCSDISTTEHSAGVNILGYGDQIQNRYPGQICRTYCTLKNLHCSMAIGTKQGNCDFSVWENHYQHKLLLISQIRCGVYKNVSKVCILIQLFCKLLFE